MLGRHLDPWFMLWGQRLRKSYHPPKLREAFEVNFMGTTGKFLVLDNWYTRNNIMLTLEQIWPGWKEEVDALRRKAASGEGCGDRQQ